MNKSGSFSSAVPVMSLYALAGYRLMPSLQGIYTSVSQLRFASAALDGLLQELKHLERVDLTYQKTLQKDVFPFNHDICLNNVSYFYPNTETPAIKNIDLKILVNTKVGFVGATGGGKTTIVDLILGLLDPSEGTLEVDGININAKIVNIGNLPLGMCLKTYIFQMTQ